MIIFMSIFLSLLAIMCLYRVIVGPTIPDRLIAADSIGVLLSMVILMVGLYFNIEILIDVVLAYAVLLFVDVLIFAKYFEHKELFK
ncbi:monovalent cation/H+ antiporter complex subunit F [Halothermothrix orenii]|uniref:Multiple resistance and pH regulation protein F n=1 Tax=Halothermothrix orenii (strain H 168 / OCM 544 / DSM 9562) TaxID=373903 RepID=B8CXE2_HALOH|nr:monovalent cation/H+ antiporter complex subunit F [Halothermothrix orenii]ACL69961.1 multiple resistance and pH regulation protein F [Halothermothrix orenii H 168]